MSGVWQSYLTCTGQCDTIATTGQASKRSLNRMPWFSCLSVVSATRRPFRTIPLDPCLDNQPVVGEYVVAFSAPGIWHNLVLSKPLWPNSDSGLEPLSLLADLPLSERSRQSSFCRTFLALYLNKRMALVVELCDPHVFGMPPSHAHLLERGCT